MLDQLRASVRSVGHRRGTAAAIVTTLTLGIGANTAIFAFIDAVLLRPLSYPDAGRLVAAYELNRGMKQSTQLVAGPARRVEQRQPHLCRARRQLFRKRHRHNQRRPGAD